MKKTWDKLKEFANKFNFISIIISIISLAFAGGTYFNNIRNTEMAEADRKPGFSFIKHDGILEIYNSKGFASDIHVIPKMFLELEYMQVQGPFDGYESSNSSKCSIELYDYFQGRVSYDSQKNAYLITEPERQKVTELEQKIGNILEDTTDYILISSSIEKNYCITYYDYKNNKQKTNYVSEEDLYSDNNKYENENEYTVKKQKEKKKTNYIEIPTVLTPPFGYHIIINHAESGTDESTGIIPWQVVENNVINEKYSDEELEDDLVNRFIKDVIVKELMIGSLDDSNEEFIDVDRDRIIKISKLYKENLIFKIFILVILVLGLSFIYVKSILLESLSLNTYFVRMMKGSTTELIVNRADGIISWKSNDDTVATVSGGVITAVGKGETTIAVSTPRQKKGCKVIVEDPRITISHITLPVHTNQQIEISGCSDNVIWESSNSKIAYVDSEGYVTAVSPGIAIITGKVYDRKYTCTVNVINSNFP